jgi:glycerol-3-phosphate acyltransferase PlsY
MSEPIFTILALFFAYICGSFPTGKLIARWYGVKIEECGSGNVGATNLARTVGKFGGALTLLVDTSKGFLTPLLIHLLEIYFFNRTKSLLLPWIGLATVLGHTISWGRFLKGGKGVATSLGVILFFKPWVAVLLAAVFFLSFYISRIVSLSSLTAAITSIIYTVIAPYSYSLKEALILISLVVILRHYENIVRFLKGEEKRFKVKE